MKNGGVTHQGTGESLRAGAAEILEDLVGEPLEEGEYKADCPTHASVSGESLSVTVTEDRVLLKCWSGCQTTDILAALGLTWPDLFFASSPNGQRGRKEKQRPPKRASFVGAEKVYEYTTPAGDPVSAAVRFPPRNGKKVIRQAFFYDGNWWWQKPEGFKPVPYNLPGIYNAVMSGKPLYIFEGEPDVEAAAEWGLVGTTAPEGASKFSEALVPYFRGADVRVNQDDDGPGAEHAEQVASMLHGSARSVKLLPPLPNPDGKLGWDFRDWKASIGTKEAYNDIVDATPLYSPHTLSKGSERGEKRKLPSMTTDELYDAAREATPWVVNGLLVRGGVTDFVGAAKESGKTTFITHMVGHVTDGLTFINRAVERSRVLYLTEMAPDNFRDYLQQAGVRRGDDLRTVFKRDVWELGWEELIEAAGEQCTAEGRGVLVVDTFAEFSGITGTEENNAGDIHKKMTVLRKVSQVHDLAVLLVRHANKEGKGRGSSAFEASVDILMLYKRPQSQDSETTVRTLEGLGRWTESNFKTNVDLKAGGFENIGNDKHIEFNRAARGILAAAGVGEENAKDRASLTKDLQTSRTTTDRALDWLVEHDSLVRVGEGVKGNPYKFFIPPKDFSPHAPGPIRGARGKKNSEPKEIPANAHISEDADSSHAPNNSAVAGELVDTDEGAAGCIAWLESVPSVALDIETYGKTKADGTSYLKGTVRLLTFHHGGETRVVDLHAVSDERAAEMLRAIGDKPKYIHNALFDLPRLYRRTGVLLKDHVFDTMLASRTARAGETEWTGAKKSHDLGAVLNRELGIPINKEIDHKWGKPLTPERLEYAVNDVLYLEELHGALARLLDKHGVSDRYDAIRATLPTFLEAAVRGVPVNRQRLEELSTSALAERDQLREALDAMAPEHPEGGTWTWNTSKNTGTEGPGRNGALRTLEVAGVKLDNLQDQTLLDRRDEHPLVAALQDYRKKAQEYSKYRKWMPEFYEDGRIYPQPKVAGAVTSRLLYSDPNIQGVEKHKTKEYRKVISPGAGMSIVTGDFAQQELRIAALISGDEEMLRTFANGEDIYLKTASKMVGYQITDKEHPARAGAKRATLGFLYGLGIDKYRENTYKDYGIALSREQANKDREAFRAAFPRFHAWQQEYGARADRETRSVLGWRRVVGLGKDNNGNPVPKYTDRLNGPIQSTAGDILYLTLAKMQEDWAAGMHPDAKFLMGVHDEIVLECPEESAKDAALWLKGKMREAFEEVLGPELGGPKSVDVGYGPSWGEQTELEEEE